MFKTWSGYLYIKKNLVRQVNSASTAIAWLQQSKMRLFHCTKYFVERVLDRGFEQALGTFTVAILSLLADRKGALVLVVVLRLLADSDTVQVPWPLSLTLSPHLLAIVKGAGARRELAGPRSCGHGEKKRGSWSCTAARMTASACAPSSSVCTASGIDLRSEWTTSTCFLFLFIKK